MTTFFFHNSYKLSGKNLILHLFKSLAYFSDASFIMRTNKLCIAYSVGHEDDTVRDIQLICESILLLQNDQFEAAQDKVRPIWSRLSEQDHLYYLDIQLVNHILFIFDVDTAGAMVDRSLKELEKYTFQDGAIKLRVLLLVNYSHLLILKGDTKRAFVQLKIAKKICETESRTDLVVYVYYYASVIFYKSGKRDFYFYYIRQAVTLVEFTLDDLAANLMISKLGNYISVEDMTETKKLYLQINKDIDYFGF